MFATAAVLLLLLAEVLATNKPMITKEGPLGQTFFIPRRDLLSSLLPPDGEQITEPEIMITEPLQKSCMEDHPLEFTKRESKFYDSTKEIYSALQKDTGLSPVGAYTMKTSLDAVSNSLGSTTESVTGFVIKIFSYSNKRTISQHCLNSIKLTKRFEDEFKNLPRKITNPKYTNSWSKYRNFILKYGSHMVQAITYGSSIFTYSFAKTSKGYSEKDFKIKACVGLQGPVGSGQAKVDLCKGVTTEDRRNVANYEMNDKVVIRGGTSATRAALLYNRNEELVTTFLGEGKATPSPVAYNFVAVWEILKTKYIGTNDYARAKNLEEYFKGYLHYDCPLKKVNDKEVQRFELAPHATDQDPTYRCVVMERGCNVHDDCDYNAGKAACSCWGSTCIQQRTEKRADGSERKIPSQGDSWDAMGCGWHWGDATCDCFEKARMLPEWENVPS